MTGSLTNSYDILLAKISAYVDQQISNLALSNAVVSVSSQNALNGVVLVQTVEDKSTQPPTLTTTPIQQFLPGNDITFNLTMVNGIPTITFTGSETLMNYLGEFATVANLPASVLVNSVAKVTTGANGIAEFYIYGTLGWTPFIQTPLIADWAQNVALSVNDTLADSTGNIELAFSATQDKIDAEITNYSGFPQPSMISTATTLLLDNFILGNESAFLVNNVSTLIDNFNFDSLLANGFPVGPLTAAGSNLTPSTVTFQADTTTQTFVLNLSPTNGDPIEEYYFSITTQVAADGTNITFDTFITIQGDWDNDPGYYNGASISASTTGVTSVNGTLPDSAGNVSILFVENSGIANQLATAHAISSTGDVAWNVSFDGTQDVSGVATLSTTGVQPGTYTKVTVDAKGRVITASNLIASDIPTLPGYVKTINQQAPDVNGNINLDVTSAVTSVNGMTGDVQVTNISGNAQTANVAVTATNATTAQTSNVVNITPTISNDFNLILGSGSGVTVLSVNNQLTTLNGPAQWVPLSTAAITGTLELLDNTGVVFQRLTFNVGAESANDMLTCYRYTLSQGTVWSAWETVLTSAPVTSVNGMTGAVTVTNISGNAQTSTNANTANALANIPAENPWTGNWLANVNGTQILQSPANTITVGGADFASNVNFTNGESFNVTNSYFGGNPPLIPVCPTNALNWEFTSPSNLQVWSAERWVDSSGDYVAFDRTYNPAPQYVMGINSDADWTATVTTPTEVATRGFNNQTTFLSTQLQTAPSSSGNWSMLGQLSLTNGTTLYAWELTGHS